MNLETLFHGASGATASIASNILLYPLELL